MSVVWRARDEMLDESVALKFVAEVVAQDAAAVDDLRQKTARARGLTDPHIVRVNDFMRDNTLATVSMEYVGGVTLEQRRLEQPSKVLSTTTLAPLIQQICPALDYAHNSAGMVHRSLRPANILVTPEGQVKIADFGVGCSLAEARIRLIGRGNRVNESMFYMSPQQLDGGPPSPADDIYALGAILYELLTGEPPFSTGDLAVQIRTQEPATIAARRAGSGVAGEPVSLAWKKTVAACLAKDPARRPSNGDEILHMLGLAGNKTAAEEVPSVAAPWPTNNPMPQPADEQATPALPVPAVEPDRTEEVAQKEEAAPKPVSALESLPPVTAGALPETGPESAVEAPVAPALPTPVVAPAPAEPGAAAATPSQSTPPTVPARASKSPYPSKMRSAIHYPTPQEAQKEADEMASGSRADTGGKRSWVGRLWTEFLRY
jgi:serine/threonine protein kinase